MGRESDVGTETTRVHVMIDRIERGRTFTRLAHQTFQRFVDSGRHI